MRWRTSFLSIVLTALTASLLASCGGNDEGHPPFEMTYTVEGRDASLQTWRLDYRSADDWTKTLIESRGEGLFSVGNTAQWNGDRISWATSPDGHFVEDGSPEPNRSDAIPEYWLGYDLDDVPNDFFEEVEAPREGTRRFRNEFLIGGMGSSAVGVEVVTFDARTGFPIEYQNTLELGGIDLHYRVIDLELR